MAADFWGYGLVMKRFAVGFCVFMACSIVSATEQWNVWGGSAVFSFNEGHLERMGLTLQGRTSDHFDPEYRSAKAIGTMAGGFKISAVNGNFNSYDSGELKFSGGPKLVGQVATIDFSQLTVRPVAQDSLELDLFDANGNHVFRATHTHLLMDVEKGSMALRNMDLSVTPWLAEAIGHKDAVDFVPGALDIEVAVDVSQNNQIEGACTNPNWPTDPGFEADVGLVSINSVQQTAESGGLVAATPSATLVNEGTADVPWWTKFDDGNPPYNNDQHPFLVWSMYKLKDGRLDQVGFSEVKHAFFTVNTACDCSGGHILWLGCEDTYGVGTNESRGSLGFRQFIDPDKGIWRRCGSAWDDSPVPGVGQCAGEVSGDGNSDAPPTGDAYDRRMTMLSSDVSDPDAEYLFQAWYVVRDDINIFNTMGFRGVDPSQSFTWTNGAGLTPYSDGPVFDYWIPATKGTSTQINALVPTGGAGSMKLGVNVVVEGDMFRYNYALMAFDFNGEVSHVEIPGGLGAAFSDYQFAAPYAATTADWTADLTDNVFAFAPTVAEDNLKWGRMVTFSFLSPDVPVASTATITAGNGTTTYEVETVAPSGLGDQIFANNFD
ncbi:MAG: hypothetical protein DHS20C11_14140 [Lysobacteraceae bacterium]|nr:MAG: hypothetical protein DHS20C11_14140 [Xanthomonadaceae bacterium]